MNIASTNFILLLSLFITLTGCVSSTKQADDTQRLDTQQQEIVTRVDSLEKGMAEWQLMQPSVARLVVIESDLKELIVQLGAMVEDPELAPALEPELEPAVEMMQAVEKPVLIDVKQAQEPTPDVIAVSEPASQQPKVQTAAAYPSAPEQPIEVSLASKNGFLANGHLGGKYALQLSSVTNPWVIESFWLKLQKKYASALEGVTPTYERASVKGKTYFRIKVGQFSKKKQATQACAQLKNIGGSCVVTLNNGVTYQQLNIKDL
ncbi:SPOR domain-containing protein [Shewanella sp.]|uniref:SPOR domain-containing protein n=1 Tax=Shewanella sp. TaxID=50422 RepID=UPI001EBDCF30|nr:SPOR domain-containing protein [Shewanella sp.]NRB23573.1 SPOR domain-containing protein [Shewanella sp.]